MIKKGYVYILRDSTGKFYVGSTTDVERRLYQHEGGHTQTTARMKNPEIMLAQVYDSLVQARKIERNIKALKRKDYIEKIVRDGYIKMKI
ncbi:MAG: GIY-YIG nuclease family protein [bacterium]|nr:GIY-YIG nuclease family protein [bacterium]